MFVVLKQRPLVIETWWLLKEPFVRNRRHHLMPAATAFQLRYPDEVSYRAACCACESVSVVQAAFLRVQGRQHRSIPSMDFSKVIAVDLLGGSKAFHQWQQVELLETLWLLPEAAPFPLPSFPSWSSVFSLLVVAHNQLVRRQYTSLHVETLLRAYWQIDANGVKLS